MIADRARERRRKLNLRQEDIAQRLQVSKSTISDWETGKRIPDIEEIDRIAEAYETTTHELMGWEYDPVPDNIHPLKRRMIPVLGNVAAGEPIWADEERDVFVDDNGTAEADFALRVKGNSMAPLIEEGDFVYIKRQPMVRNGQIAVILDHDSATLKYFYNHGTSVQLVSHNPEYQPMAYDGAAASDLHILGLAVSFKRSLLK